MRLVIKDSRQDEKDDEGRGECERKGITECSQDLVAGEAVSRQCLVGFAGESK